MNKKYEIAWNTGDIYWDDLPKYEECDTLEEVEDAIGRMLSAQEVQELEDGFIVSDEYDVEYEIKIIKK